LQPCWHYRSSKSAERKIPYLVRSMSANTKSSVNAVSARRCICFSRDRHAQILGARKHRAKIALSKRYARSILNLTEKRPADYNIRSRYLRNDSSIKNDSAATVKQWFAATLQHLDIVRNSLGQMWITGRSDTFANQAGYKVLGARRAACSGGLRGGISVKCAEEGGNHHEKNAIQNKCWQCRLRLTHSAAAAIPESPNWFNICFNSVSSTRWAASCGDTHSQMR